MEHVCSGDATAGADACAAAEPLVKSSPETSQVVTTLKDGILRAVAIGVPRSPSCGGGREMAFEVEFTTLDCSHFSEGCRMETDGIRELKAHLSRHLKRVRSGARLVVTARGRSIAHHQSGRNTN